MTNNVVDEINANYKPLIFIHPTTRESSGRHKTKSEFVEYGNVKDTDEEIGRKIRAMLKKCD